MADYEDKETDIPGVQARILQGTKILVPSAIISVLYSLAARYAVVKRSMEAEGKEQKKSKGKIVQCIEAVPGLRGIRSEPDDLDFLAVLEEAMTWDRDLMKQSLGAAYPAYVTEEVTFNIPLIPGKISLENLIQSLTQLLETFGIKPEDMPKILETNILLRIDTEKLEQDIKSGKITLLPGAKIVDNTWSLKVNPLRIPQKQAKKKISKPKKKEDLPEE